jgi:hypothetical protein
MKLIPAFSQNMLSAVSPGDDGAHKRAQHGAGTFAMFGGYLCAWLVPRGGRSS